MEALCIVWKFDPPPEAKTANLFLKKPWLSLPSSLSATFSLSNLILVQLILETVADGVEKTRGIHSRAGARSLGRLLSRGGRWGWSLMKLREGEKTGEEVAEKDMDMDMLELIIIIIIIIFVFCCFFFFFFFPLQNLRETQKLYERQLLGSSLNRAVCSNRFGLNRFQNKKNPGLVYVWKLLNRLRLNRFD